MQDAYTMNMMPKLIFARPNGGESNIEKLPLLLQ